MKKTYVEPHFRGIYFTQVMVFITFLTLVIMLGMSDKIEQNYTSFVICIYAAAFSFYLSNKVMQKNFITNRIM